MTLSAGGSVFSPRVVQRERWSGVLQESATTLVSPGQEVMPDQPVLRLPQQLVLDVADPALDSSLEREETVPAGLRGQVVALTDRGGVVIESSALHIPGRLGAGRQVAGILKLWQDGLSPQQQTIPPGAILVIPSMLNFTLLRRAVASGVVGIVAGSIPLRELEAFLRADLVMLQSSEDEMTLRKHARTLPLSLLLTEGLGPRVMPAPFVSLFNRYQGSIALLDGYTHLRRGIFPELLISLSPEEIQAEPVTPLNLALVPSALVRICSGAYASMVGIIEYLFAYSYTFPSGIQARAARVRCEDDVYRIIPLTSLERIG